MTKDEPITSRGAAKQTEPTDPLELVAASAPGGDVDYTLRCMIEEYALLGYGRRAILELFRSPEYLALHRLYQARGERAIRQTIDDVLAECGVLRVTETVSETTPACPEPVGLGRPSGSAGGRKQ